MGEAASSSGRGASGVLPLVGRVAGGLGTLACLGALVFVLVVRARVVERVDRVEARVLRAIDLAAAPLAAARERVETLSARVEEVGRLLRERAADVFAERLSALRERLDQVAERLEAVRATWIDVRVRIVALLERLRGIDEALSAISLPTEELDQFADRVDVAVTGIAALVDEWLGRLRNAAADPVVAERSATWAVERAPTLADGIAGMSREFADLAARVERLRSAVAERADRARGRVTWGAVGLAVAVLWLAFLHVVLFLWAGRSRRVA